MSASTALQDARERIAQALDGAKWPKTCATALTWTP